MPVLTAQPYLAPPSLEAAAGYPPPPFQPLVHTITVPPKQQLRRISSPLLPWTRAHCPGSAIQPAAHHPPHGPEHNLSPRRSSLDPSPAPSPAVPNQRPKSLCRALHTAPPPICPCPAPRRCCLHCAAVAASHPSHHPKPVLSSSCLSC
ncbi:hypothetical protein M0R45_001871 [Rubus argutus]|uniref:Uncharacterized protein n=1 Tax=Rubus argutus TaxID=59490 RepID=A0AAW1VJU4_RUBAR